MDLESAFEEGFDEKYEADLQSNMTGNGTLYYNTVINEPTRIILAIAFLVMTVVGIVGNIFVIWAVILSRRLQTAMNAFVVNLAVADLLACVTFPYQAMSLLMVGNIPVWICVAMAVMSITSLGSSLFTITMIGINRYILITKAKNIYHNIFTAKKMAVMIAIAWIVAPICMIISSARICGIFLVKHGAGFLSWIVPLFLIASLVTILTCYILIFMFIKRHVQRSMASSSKRLDVSITKNLLYVVCGFYACVLPYTIVVTAAKFAYDPRYPDMNHAFRTASTYFIVILNLNSVINPIIYAARHPIFKPIFGYMIKRQWYMIPEPSRFAKSISRDQRDGSGMEKSLSSGVRTELTDNVSSAYV